MGFPLGFVFFVSIAKKEPFLFRKRPVSLVQIAQDF